MRSELTLHHCEAEEVQLFDSKTLCHVIKNTLPCGLRLEQVKDKKKVCIQYVVTMCKNYLAAKILL